MGRQAKEDIGNGLLSFQNYSYKGRKVNPKPRSNLNEKTDISIKRSRQEENKLASFSLQLSFKESFKYNIHDSFSLLNCSQSLFLLLLLYDILLICFTNVSTVYSPSQHNKRVSHVLHNLPFVHTQRARWLRSPQQEE